MTPAQLIAAGVGPTQAKIFAAPLAAACAMFGIDTPARVAALVGQCMVESALFVHTEENLFYSTPDRLSLIFRSAFPTTADAVPYLKNPQKLANRVYAGRYGNGPEASGDGWRYRGRGLIQTTFKANYQAAATEVGRDYVAQPELLAQPEDACLAAAAFWFAKKLSPLADANNIDGITKIVNAGMADAGLRRQYTQQALAALMDT